MKKQPKYLFYATLLDGFQNYLSSAETYQQYWGFSEDPEKSEEEFEQQQFQDLIDRINRVPFDSEAADKGTAFNEVVDCIIEHRKSDKMQIEVLYAAEFVDGQEVKGSPYAIKVTYNEREFEFSYAVCSEFAKYYKGAVCQVHTEALLPTKYGEVLLYGYIDELMPLSVHDIKTTSKYSAGKFKNNWQHIVYPYCLGENGNNVSDFEYNVAVINKSGTYSTFTEHYAYKPERDTKRLTAHVEALIEFIELHRDKITDKKIFNEHEQVINQGAE